MFIKIKNMKKILAILLASVLIISCGKVIEYSNDFSAVAFINAAPSSSTAAISTNFNVFVDTIVQSASVVTYRGSSGYLPVKPGTRMVELRNVTNFVTYKFFENPAMEFTTNTASTVFVYDTLSASNLTLKTIRLNDELSLPPAGFIKVRFIPLAVKSAPVDVTYLRTSVTPNDSVTISNQAYIGPSPSASAIQALSTFMQIPVGAYTVKLKTTGTQTVLTSAAFTLTTLTGSGNTTGINTFFSTGTAQGQALSIGQFRNYP